MLDATTLGVVGLVTHVLLVASGPVLITSGGWWWLWVISVTPPAFLGDDPTCSNLLLLPIGTLAVVGRALCAATALDMITEAAATAPAGGGGGVAAGLLVLVGLMKNGVFCCGCWLVLVSLANDACLG